MRGITDKTIPINFEVGKGITGNLDAVQKKVEASQMAAAGWNNALGRAAMGAKGAADATKNIGEEAKKSTDHLGNIQSKFEGVGSAIEGVKGKLAALTAILAGGSLMGYSWKGAEESANYAEQVYDMLSTRKGSKKIDQAALKTFVSKATDSGYTSSTDRLQLANLMIQRGAKTTDSAIGATEGIERKFITKREMLEKDYGISSAKSLGEYATQANIRGKQAQQDLDNIFGPGFSRKSQATRIKLLAKIDISDEDLDKALDPLDVIQTRLHSISKSVGSELRGPLGAIADLFADFLGAVDRNPLLPKILAITAGFVGVAGAVVGIVVAMAEVKKALGALEMGSKLMSMGSMLMNPYVALIALAAILLIVAYKTGVLQKAWDKFQQSAIGKDIMSGLQGLADFAGTLIDRFSKWYEDSGKNQMLSAFFTLVEVLGNAWDYVDKIYSTMTKGGANPIVAALTAISAAPLALGMGIAKTVTGKDSGELLDYLIELDQRWINYLITNFPLFGKIYEIIKKVHSVMEWLYSLLQGALAWIRDGLGITKSQKKEKLDKAAEAAGVTWDADEQRWYKGNVPATNPKSGVSAATLANLDELKDKYEKAPKGFFEGIPGITDLTTALQNLLSPINNLIDALKLKDIANSANTIAEKVGFTGGASAGKTPVVDDEKWEIWNSADSPDHFFVKSKTGDPRVPGQGDTYSRELVETLYGGSLPTEGHAAGATFKRGGLFAGKVHSPEEIIPQAIASRGPGPIARAIAALDAVTAGRAVASGASGASFGDIHVHMPAQDFSGMKISSNVDLKRVLSDANKRAVDDAVEKVKRLIGQGRT